MIGKKKLFSSVAGIVVVAAMAFGTSQAFAIAPKTGYAPGCEPHPSCPFGNSGKPGQVLCCDPL